ncbi:hypothetical protein Ancab_019437 [Ancistrocladus abbreviatus]
MVVKGDLSYDKVGAESCYSVLSIMRWLKLNVDGDLFEDYGASVGLVFQVSVHAVVAAENWSYMVHAALAKLMRLLVASAAFLFCLVALLLARREKVLFMIHPSKHHLLDCAEFCLEDLTVDQAELAKGNMWRTTIPVLAFLAAFLILVSRLDSQLVARPPPTGHLHCEAQYALVNHACSLIPYAPLQPHPPVPPPTRHHRHRAHWRRRHHYHETPVERECCRWLTVMDAQCVCDLLARLPVFLSRPLHNYTVYVDPGCRIMFECPGRVVMA